ncbi:MAG: hypothetical protein Q8P70_02160 [bacterium]|nr:hypothetical protein [bacterium]
MHSQERTKVIDIKPPKRLGGNIRRWEWKDNSAVENVSKKSSTRRLILKTISLVLLLTGIIGGGLWHVLAEANVVVSYKTREVQRAAEIMPGEELVFQMAERDWTEEDTFPVSGKETIAEQAEGIIRVFNTSTSNQTLVATTRFMSEDGKLFRSLERVVVPASGKEGSRTVPGQKDVRVRAAEAGEEYNIPTSKFSIPGLSTLPLYTQIYGESLEPMKGGMKREVSTVRDEDMEKAKEVITLKAKERALLQLAEKDVPPGYFLLLPTHSFENERITFSHLKGEEATEIVVRVQLTVMAGIALVEDVEKAASVVLSEELLSDELLYEESFDISFTEGQRKESLLLTARALAYREVTSREITSLLAGMAVGKAEQELNSHPYLQKADVSITPFWRGSLPRGEQKIHVRFSF